MAKYRDENDGTDDEGWTRWILPEPDLYKMACCDCGLVHNLQFRVTDDGRAEFRVQRNNRATGQMRRHMISPGNELVLHKRKNQKGPESC